MQKQLLQASPRWEPGLLAHPWIGRYELAAFPPEKPIPRVRTNRRLSVLTHREARIVLAVADTLFPSDGTGMSSVKEAEVVEYLDDLLFHLPLKEKTLIRCLLALLEVQMLVFNGTKPTLFSRADAKARTRNLAGWEKSRIFQRRLVFMAIRTLLLWAYVDSREVERDMGFSSGTRRTAERNAERLRAARQAIDTAHGRAPTALAPVVPGWSAAISRLEEQA